MVKPDQPTPDDQPVVHGVTAGIEGAGGSATFLIAVVPEPPNPPLQPMTGEKICVWPPLNAAPPVPPVAFPPVPLPPVALDDDLALALACALASARADCLTETPTD